MIRFLFWTIIFLVAGGLILHFDVNIPWISNWLGKLPGDFTIQKNKTIVYFPITSAAIVSFIFSVILWLVFANKKQK